MKIKKKHLIISIPILAILIALGGYLTYFFNELDKAKRGYVQSFDPTTEIGRANIEMRRRIDEKMKHEIKGNAYFKQGKYELAVEEYKKAPNKWMSHYGLADTYEAMGRYEDAINEIDWLIAQNPRPDVIQELQERKERLEKLLEQGMSSPEK
jgi:tetratricopeptide (TPR) repeat protein